MQDNLFSTNQLQNKYILVPQTQQPVFLQQQQPVFLPQIQFKRTD